MRQTKVTALVEAGSMAAVAIGFAFISAYVPLIGTVVLLIWPVPIVLLGVRHGYKWSILTTFVAGILIAILINPLHALSFVVGYGFLATTLGHCFRKKYKSSKTLALGVVATLISMGGIIVLGILLTGVNIWDTQMALMNTSMDQVAAIYRTMGVTEDRLAVIQVMADQFKVMLAKLMPAGLIMAGIFITGVNFLISRKILSRLGNQVPGFPPFREWSFPKETLYVFLLAVGMMFLGNSQHSEIIEQTGFNLYYILNMVIIIQGMAVFCFFAVSHKIPNMVRNIVLVMAFVLPLVATAMVCAGIFDLATDYRELRIKKEPEQGR
jgi:uncharacterized protein YybS (DUF2232 family)